MTTATQEVKKATKPNKIVTLPLNKIATDISINVRFKNNLDIATMKDAIATEGNVTDAIHVFQPTEKDAATLGSNGKLVVIRGYRRMLASEAIHNEPDQWTATLVEAVKTIPAIVHEGMTLAEAEDMVLDHNSMKRISKSEIVHSINRRFLAGKTEIDIILDMHRIIGEDLVGKADKVKELERITNPKKRKDFARTWLHTFVGKYLIRACKLGPFVREQVLLHFKAGDGLLEDGEVVHFKANTSAIQALSAAKTEDDKDSSWVSGVTGITINGDGLTAESVQGGGTQTRQVIVDLITAHKSGVVRSTDNGPKPLSKKDLEDRKDSFQSQAVIGAFRLALGHEVPTLADEDLKAARRVEVEKVLLAAISGLKIDNKVKVLLQEILDHNVNVTKVAETCKSLS